MYALTPAKMIAVRLPIPKWEFGPSWDPQSLQVKARDSMVRGLYSLPPSVKTPGIKWVAMNQQVGREVAMNRPPPLVHCLGISILR